MSTSTLRPLLGPAHAPSKSGAHGRQPGVAFDGHEREPGAAEDQQRSEGFLAGVVG
ncbi:MAG TPA: hypothetical protein VHM23_21655 [Actinomycetota bacterium]|jgi:hypothetical protein|nr:hypothetical protein [Actinomycetota bacterium]